MNEIIQAAYYAPETRYFKTQQLFSEAVGKDFIKYANNSTIKNKNFFVGLSHGQSPIGAYQYILDHYYEIKNKKNIFYSFINSPLKSQEGLADVMNTNKFLKTLLRRGFITIDQVLGRDVREETINIDAVVFNETINSFLKYNNKLGFDYVFLASNPSGRIAGIERNSKAFDSKEVAVIVTLNKEKELTTTPYFLSQSKRIALLATKADKRRPLAWLFSTSGLPNESPSFIRHIENVREKVTVFIDDKALTWPEIILKRETPYGTSNIILDLVNPYKPNAKEKLPVVILIHGFLGLNSFDGLLTSMHTKKYIGAAMHYGSIPSDLPIDEYSEHVAKNINTVVQYFGENGHSVYIFDHSMSNIYMLMIDQNIEKYPAIRKYLKGRIGANPFFGEEAKHALLGFLDNVIIPSTSFASNPVEKSVMVTLRRIIPLDPKLSVRKRGIDLAKSLIAKDNTNTSLLWNSIKQRIVYLMSNMDSLPQLNRIPIERALNKVPAKIFAIQSYSALKESKAFDAQIGLVNLPKYMPILILKSDRDGVAKFVPRLYQGDNVQIIDITHPTEKDLFREHLYHMVNPQTTAKIIEDFIIGIERKSNNAV